MLPFEPLKFSSDWINSWNIHDIESILSHYSEEVEFTSPFVVQLLNQKNGTLTGKLALRDYFMKGLAAYPDLKFELLQVTVGVSSIVLIYKSVKNLTAAEMMLFDDAGRVSKVFAHYYRVP